MLFWTIEMLSRLFVWNSNGELRRTTTISYPLGIVEQQLFSLFRNNRFAFDCTVAISIPRTTTIPLFSCHLNVPYVLKSLTVWLLLYNCTNNNNNNYLTYLLWYINLLIYELVTIVVLEIQHVSLWYLWLFYICESKFV
jgi:hypothetical protein